MAGILAAAAGFRIRYDYEDAVLEWPGGRLALGDHYGDPACALLDLDQGWCVVGGEGLVVHDFGRPISAAAPPQADQVRRHELWRRANPPPDGARCWFVTALAPLGAQRVRAVTDEHGAFEIDLASRTFRRLEA